MGTGACGIDCDVCRLHVRGLCSTCGPGESPDGSRKLKAQNRIFHGYCPVLKCAHDHNVSYCPRDCRRFPCETFEQGPYPYSGAYLAMQKRRRKEIRAPSPPNLNRMNQWKLEDLPAEYWDELASLDPKDVCSRTGAAYDERGEAYTILLLNQPYRVLPFRRLLTKGGDLSGIDYRFPEISFVESLILIVYLLKARDVGPSHRRITEKELPGGEVFFRGPHELSRAPVLTRFKCSPDGFLRAGIALGGEKISFGDAALRLQALPRIPIEYILWTEDDEFPARLTITFDVTAADHLPLDVLWALVHFVTERLAGSPV